MALIMVYNLIIVSQLLKGVKTFLIQSNNRNCNIYIGVVKQHTYALKCLLFEKIVKNQFSRHKICFSQFSRKESILDSMLLHNSNINMAIAVIFDVSKKSLQCSGAEIGLKQMHCEI